MSVYDKPYSKNEFLFTRGFAFSALTEKKYLFKTGENEIEIELKTVGYLKTGTTGTNNRRMIFTIKEIKESDITITNIGTVPTPTVFINKNRNKSDALPTGCTMTQDPVISYTNSTQILISEGVASETQVETVTDLNYNLELRPNTYYELRSFTADGNIISGVDMAIRGTMREVKYN